MLSVLVMGSHDGSRRALEERVAAIGDFAVVPRDHRRPPAADVLMVAADRNAFDETRRIAARAAASPPPMLVVADEPFAELLSVIWLGARGIVLSSATDRELADCVTVVARRCTVVPERLLDDERLRTGGRLPGGRPPHGHAPREALDRLSPRELEVLKLVAAGRTNAEIAERLWLSSNTVRSHVQRIMRKLGVRNRLCLIIFAHELRLLGPAAPARGGGETGRAAVPAAGSHPVDAPDQGV